MPAPALESLSAPEQTVLRRLLARDFDGLLSRTRLNRWTVMRAGAGLTSTNAVLLVLRAELARDGGRQRRAPRKVDPAAETRSA